MARSRVEKFGTIFQRMNGLIRSGTVKHKDRPLWFDVYEAFPPKRAPKYEQVLPDQNVRTILYAEDLLRAKLGHNRMETVDMMTPGELESEKFIRKYIELKRTAKPGTDVFEETKKAVKWEEDTIEKRDMAEQRLGMLKQMLYQVKDKSQQKQAIENFEEILDEQTIENLLSEMNEPVDADDIGDEPYTDIDERVKAGTYTEFDEENILPTSNKD